VFASPVSSATCPSLGNVANLTGPEDTKEALCSRSAVRGASDATRAVSAFVSTDVMESSAGNRDSGRERNESSKSGSETPPGPTPNAATKHINHKLTHDTRSRASILEESSKGKTNRRLCSFI
jgi:hypothetical protein